MKINYYKKVYDWYRKNVGLIQPDNTISAPWMSGHPIKLHEADQSRRLIAALPPPDKATSAEIRAVMREVLMGRLEWAFHAPDGSAKIADHAKLFMGDAPSDWRLSDADKESIRKSTIYPWLSDHLKR